MTTNPTTRRTPTPTDQPRIPDPTDLTPVEFAQRVGRAYDTVRWWLNSGRVPGAYRDGCHWRIPIEHAIAPPPRPREPTYPKFE